MFYISLYVHVCRPVTTCLSLIDICVFNTFSSRERRWVYRMYMRVFICMCVWTVYGSMQSFCVLMWVCVSLSLCVSVCVSGWLGGFGYSRSKWKSRLKHLLSNYPAKSQNQAFVKHLCTNARQGWCARMCVLNSFTCEVSANVCSFSGSLKNRRLKILVDFTPQRSHWLILNTLEILLRYPSPPLYRDSLAKILQNTQLPHIH